jgi:hypothetical protein
VGVELDRDRRAQNQAGTGGGGEGRKIDMRLPWFVVAADHTWQHARVWSFRLASYQGQPDAGFRAHSEASQHLDMGVPGPEEQNVRLNGAA